MKKIVEILKYAGDEASGSVSREYKDIGFLGACRQLWHFWRHNGTSLDDYHEFRIRVIDLGKKRTEQEPMKIDDTRIFGYTVKEFNNLPNEIKTRLLLPLSFTVFEPVKTPVEDKEEA